MVLSKFWTSVVSGHFWLWEIRFKSNWRKLLLRTFEEIDLRLGNKLKHHNFQFLPYDELKTNFQSTLEIRTKSWFAPTGALQFQFSCAKNRQGLLCQKNWPIAQRELFSDVYIFMSFLFPMPGIHCSFRVKYRAENFSFSYIPKTDAELFTDRRFISTTALKALCERKRFKNLSRKARFFPLSNPVVTFQAVPLRILIILIRF